MTSGICFPAQQAPGKYLKALLVHLNRPFPPTHDLGALTALLAADCPPASELRGRADALTEYAVQVRYPDALDTPDEQEARAALAAAGQIREFCSARLS